MTNARRSMICWTAAAMIAAGSIGCVDFFSDPTVWAQGTGSTGGTAGTGGTGGAGGAPAECIPNQAPGAIEESCGVFVAASKGSDTNAGTKEKPFATLAKAIEAAKGKLIYACADTAKPFDEAVMVGGEANIFGSIDCATWKYAPQTKTKWTASADAVPLSVAGGASVSLQDIAIEAADATKAGGSSVAILAGLDVSLTLARCEVTAGNGKDGATPEAPMGSGMTGVPGVVGKDGCLTMDDLTGGKGGALTCDGTDASGGPGGQGLTASTGGAGSPGQPEDGTNGLGGSGQKEMPATACTQGGDGAEGLPGDPGEGATSKGLLSPTGYQGDDGKDGASIGKPGQGGGGGGGAKKCGANAGPSAGGGGSGGCGGAVGKGGKAGGASIAIVSVGAKLVLSDVRISAKNGGKGGDGGPGQPGGDGGAGGPPGMEGGTASACAGGKGGKGGPGGRGGGGLGGHSIGIAHTGAAPSTDGATITPGKAGNGGAGDAPNGDGAPGLAKGVQGF